MLLEDLSEVHGLGPTRAQKLIDAGLKRIADLKKRQFFDTLPIETQMWIQYKPLKIIPRKLIDDLLADLATMWRYRWQVAGSYRRGKSQSRDIDIIVSADIKKVLADLLFEHHVYSIGPSKASLLVKFRRRYVKLDIMKADKDWAFQLLYLTGSKEHNIMMRAKAKKQGLLLNQHGLYRGTTLIRLTSEAEIFEYLGMDYVEPTSR